MFARIKEIFAYRDMMNNLVKRELAGRYKKSVLGFLWSFINPLFQILIFTIVFTYVFPSGIDKYYVYLMTGMIPWTFFSDSLLQGATCVVAMSDMAKKIYFPREVLPIASVTAKFKNMLFSFVIVALFLFFSGVGFDLRYLWILPFTMLVEYLMALGCALFFSAVTVYLRDMEFIVGIIVMAWIWGTPIMYAYDGLPPMIQKVIHLNPLTSVMIQYRNILFYHRPTDWRDFLYPAVASVCILLVGALVFRKLERDFAEEL